MAWHSLFRTTRQPTTSETAAERAAPFVRPGEKIAGKYTVLHEIGRGAQGQVYLCRYDITGQDVALKVLHRELLHHPENAMRLREEGRRWVELGVHPNVVAAYNIEEHARLPCIAMQYVPQARSLAEFCAAASLSGRAMGWQAALMVAGQVACGLDHAWKSSQLLHRDIKPANILLTTSGVAKLTDFGLSVAQSIERPSTGVMVGTPLYMAPELWEGRFSAMAADIYALGITMFEVIAGRWPFAGRDLQTLNDMKQCHRDAPVPDVRAIAPRIPDELAKLVHACMAKDPRRRPDDIRQILGRLESIAQREFGGGFIDANPDVTIAEADRLINLSSMHNKLGNADEARKYAERAMALAADSANAWMALGNALRSAGDLGRAVAHFTKALELGPADDARQGLLNNLAQVAFETGDEQAGRMWLQRAIRAAEERNQLGQLDALSSDFTRLLSPDEATRLCDRVIAANPSAAVTWNNRAIICRQSGRYSAAEWSARQAIGLNPLYAKAWTNLANALLNQTKYEEGMAAARRSIEIDPKTGGAYLAMMIAYRELGDIASARAIIEEGARMVPRNQHLQRALQLVRSARFAGPDWNAAN